MHFYTNITTRIGSHEHVHFFNIKNQPNDVSRLPIRVIILKCIGHRFLHDSQVKLPVRNTFVLAALAETLFRTQSMQAYSAGRWNTANDKDFSDYIWGFEYITAHDDRVREGHRVLDGVRLPKDDPDAFIDFGITGRDPRTRTPDEMNVPVGFVGNVGMIEDFLVKKPEKRRFFEENTENLREFSEGRIEIEDNGGIINLLKKHELDKERVDFFRKVELDKAPQIGTNFERLPPHTAKILSNAEYILRDFLNGGSGGTASGCERSAFINENGEAVFYNVGSEHSVSAIPKNTKIRFQTKNGISVHSHPSSSPPSLSDIRVFLSNELMELSIVTAYGIYRIIRTRPVKLDAQNEKLIEDFKRMYGANLKEVKIMIQQKTIPEQNLFRKKAMKKYKSPFVSDDFIAYEYCFEKLVEHFQEIFEVTYESYRE